MTHTPLVHYRLTDKVPACDSSNFVACTTDKSKVTCKKCLDEIKKGNV